MVYGIFSIRKRELSFDLVSRSAAQLIDLAPSP